MSDPTSRWRGFMGTDAAVFAARHPEALAGSGVWEDGVFDGDRPTPAVPEDSAPDGAGRSRDDGTGHTAPTS